MQNRAQDAPYRQGADSLDFHLVRAKLRADGGAGFRHGIAAWALRLRQRVTAS